MKNIRTNKTHRLVVAGSALAFLLSLPVAAQPAASEPADAPAQIDRQERQPVVRTYEKFADPDGDDQDIEVSTYDKAPDPDGDSQDLEYVRYQEQNDANDGERYNPTLKQVEKDD